MDRSDVGRYRGANVRSFLVYLACLWVSFGAGAYLGGA
jgi:hypothetical protein